MHIIDFATAPGAVIEPFASVGTTSDHLGDGVGESHVYAVRFAPNSQMGEPDIGFGQLLLVIEGSDRRPASHVVNFRRWEVIWDDCNYDPDVRLSLMPRALSSTGCPPSHNYPGDFTLR